MSATIEESRLKISKSTAQNKKASLGQFFTPTGIAQFMAQMFDKPKGDKCRLLDAGAGIGSLSAAFMNRRISGGFDFKRIDIDAFELDKKLLPHLAETLERYKNAADVSVAVRNADFVEAAVESLKGNLFSKSLPKYTHTILNPPYKKIRGNSAHRLALRQVGIETVNLYSAFVALSLALLGTGGQLVAIIPRSFCNGLYYLPFRKYILAHAAIRHIHLFDSRYDAFKDENVLQENIIIKLEKGGKQGDVKISTSTDADFSDLAATTHRFPNIVAPDDSHHFIHIPTTPETETARRFDSIRYTLDDIGVSVSTGPVVDFRLKEHLRPMPEAGTVPLLYPGHFTDGSTDWPKPGFKKPNAIIRNDETEKWLYPNGCYCVVRRVSSKEEKRRVVAAVVLPEDFPNWELLGFENHLNVFHEGKKGIPKPLAYGLAAYLNTTMVDETFRRFNGHTQVNATDLRRIKYPSREILTAMGEWAIQCETPTQALIDRQLQELAA